jgi:hypothetical protein
MCDISTVRAGYLWRASLRMCRAETDPLSQRAYQQDGQEGVEQDFEQCSEMAKDAGATANQGQSWQVAGGVSVWTLSSLASEQCR